MNNNIEYKDFSNKKVIIIDDDLMNANIAAKLLEPYNIKAEKIYSGEELLEKINSGNTYDLIILDDMMPQMSGTETMKKLKSNLNFTTPIVVLTGNTIDGAKEQYLKDGFDDFMAKPINRTLYNEMLQKYLSKII